MSSSQQQVQQAILNEADAQRPSSMRSEGPGQSTVTAISRSDLIDLVGLEALEAENAMPMQVIVVNKNCRKTQ